MNRPYDIDDLAFDIALRAAMSECYSDEFMRQHREMIVALLPPECMPLAPKLCPHCGQPMVASTPAADAPVMPVPAKDANVTHEPPPSGWRRRPPLA